MNKITFIVFGVLLSFFSIESAQAAKYECFAKENKERGFNFDFTISVEPITVGGQIFLTAGAGQRMLGTVSEIGLLKRDDSAQRSAFDLTLGLVDNGDVSGVSDGSLNKVRTIEFFRAKTADGDEVLVYKFLDDSAQVGGTVLISGLGTACIPRNSN